MRCTMILAAATAAVLTAMSATGAHAEGWCGFTAQAKSVIQCGYSSNTECENAIGKGGMCFVDPEYAFDATGRTPRAASRPTAGPG